MYQVLNRLYTSEVKAEPSEMFSNGQLCNGYVAAGRQAPDVKGDMNKYYNIIQITCYRCCLCQCILVSQQDYDNHVKTIHAVANPQNMVHKFVCHICCRDFIDAKQLEMHRGTIVQQCFQCILCNKMFDSVSVVLQHYNDMHVVKSEQYPSTSSLQDTITKKAYADCLTNYKVEALSEGQLTTALYRRNYPEWFSTGPKPEPLPSAENAHTIPYSEDALAAKSSGETAHPGGDIHRCPHCEKSFSLASSLKRHMGSHTGERPYKCSYCEKEFFQKSMKISHELVHNQDKPHKCSYCEKRFTRKTTRNEHESIHTGRKSLKCTYCEKTFHLTRLLKQHLLIHLGNGPKKSYKCSYCGKDFTRQSSKNEHELIHTGKKPFKCSFCEKSFRVNRFLKLHIMSHTGEQPFGCAYCDKRFIQKYLKDRHERCHVGAKAS